MSNPRDPLDPLDAFVEARGLGALDDLIEWAKQLRSARPEQRAATTEGYRFTRPDFAELSELIEQVGAERVIESLEGARAQAHRGKFRFIEGELPG